MNTQLSNQELEELILSYLPRESSLADRVRDAMNYSVEVGGKRLRPRLMFESYRSFGGEEEAIGPFMAAMEMIHTYSLVHDDLPCMDNDTLRRGKPTTWSVYGEDFGVLAGDGLLTYAFETACKAFAMSEHPERVARAMQVLAEKAGLRGMVGGQSVDVYKTGQKLTEEELDFIYELKTGCLIEASMMIGAILAGAGEAGVMLAKEVGALIGLAFQIRDDILDVIADEKTLGKPIGSDAKNEKTTYVTLYGIAEAENKVQQLTNKAMRNLRHFPEDTSYLSELIEGLSRREK